MQADRESGPPAVTRRVVTTEAWTGEGRVRTEPLQETGPLELEGFLPGERVEVELEATPDGGVRRRGRRAWRLASARLLESSADRVEPGCPVFGLCGGCALQHASYAAQLAWKRERVQAALARAGLPAERVEPVLGAARSYAYRNKMEFTFSPEGRPGLHRRGRWREVLPLERCPIALHPIQEALGAVARWAEAERLPGYDKEANRGFLRHLLLRASEAGGEWMAVLATTPPATLEGGEERWRGALERLGERLAAVEGFASLQWVEDAEPGDALHFARAPRVVRGAATIEERLGGLRFRLGPETFFQTHTAQAERLLETALALAAPAAGERVLDLYAGVGTFTLPLARAVGPAGEAVGVEVVEASVEAGRAAARENGLGNARWVAAKVRSFLAGLSGERPWSTVLGAPPLPEGWRPGLVLLDPPRSGAGRKVMERIAALRPRRILYVSCNPEALAEDLALLVPRGWELAVARPVDLFPQTPHVETVALLHPAAGSGSR
ncbi:MAG: 23S rRNA (uracil(1939)-C(5))-methyltransferase RlmD [Bacillota bacterium]|nr:23S rRNA (uracil(1939)-C(5))-methyltransferase RlmD [Bacillota bacterium]